MNGIRQGWGGFSGGLWESPQVPQNGILQGIGITDGRGMDGTSNSPLYSQESSGHYASLPETVWFKQDSNSTWLVYSKLNIALDSMVGLHFHYNNCS